MAVKLRVLRMLASTTIAQHLAISQDSKNEWVYNPQTFCCAVREKGATFFYVGCAQQARADAQRNAVTRFMVFRSDHL